MDKYKVIDTIKNYLEANNIYFIKDVDNGVSRITIGYSGYEKCLDKVLESCIWFYDNEMEVRVYYDENAANLCKNSHNLTKLYRLFNYINANVWTCTTNNIFKNQHLYTSRIYLSEDESYDIMMTTIIAYDFFCFRENDTLYYMTVYCPNIMNELCPIIFGVIFNSLTNEEAFNFIDENIIQIEKEAVVN